jgi:hypothetical protein
MTEATQALDKVPDGSSNKRKKRPLQVFYYEREGETTYLLYDATNDIFYSYYTQRPPQGRLYKQETRGDHARKKTNTHSPMGRRTHSCSIPKT